MQCSYSENHCQIVLPVTSNKNGTISLFRKLLTYIIPSGDNENVARSALQHCQVAFLANSSDNGAISVFRKILPVFPVPNTNMDLTV